MSDAKRHEQELSWGDVMWAWIKNGYPREEAAHRADLFMKRRERERNDQPMNHKRGCVSPREARRHASAYKP